MLCWLHTIGRLSTLNVRQVGVASTRTVILLFFNLLGVFYRRLGSIHIIIDGYSYVIRVGLEFSRFFIHEQGCCCTAALD